MANEDKFSKTIDDEQLDEVAGGTKAEIQKDIKFLNAIGAKLDKNATNREVQAAWMEFDIYNKLETSGKNEYSRVLEKFHSEKQGDYRTVSENIGRQDAMIEVMRKTGKFVDLDQYL